MTAAPVEAPVVLRACVFTVDDVVFALPVDAVREVVIVEQWTTVPLAPGYVLGVANRRGAVLPVADAHEVLGLGARPRGGRLRTIVVGAGSLEVALAVDDVLGLETFEEVLPVDNGVDAAYGGCTVGLLPRHGRQVSLLDAARLVAMVRGGAS
jgi:chemotaxis signal transduction protein